MHEFTGLTGYRNSWCSRILDSVSPGWLERIQAQPIGFLLCGDLDTARVPCRRHADMPRESDAESAGRAVADALGHLGDADIPMPQQVPGQCHAPGQQVLHWRHAHYPVETVEEGRAGECGLAGQLVDGPDPCRMRM